MQNEKSITEKIPKSLDGKAAFRFLNGNRKNDVVQINKDVFFIGRSEINDLVAGDRTVSRKHAVVNYSDNKYIISDLNSFKGVVINGQKTHETALHPGDRIKLGNTLIEFSIEGELPRVIHRGWFSNPKTIVLLLAVILTIAAIKIFWTASPVKQDDSPAGQIEYNYSMGIKAYNVNKNFERAATYWNKVLELDPERKTVQARNVLILLSNIGVPNAPQPPPEEGVVEDMPYGGERPVE